MLDSLVRVSRRGKENHFVKLSQDGHRHEVINSHNAVLANPTKPDRGQDTAPTPQAEGEVCLGKHWFPSLPFQQFQVLFNSLFKVLCIFPSRYLYAIGLPPIFSFRWNLPPTLSCNPKQLDSLTSGSSCQANGSLTLSAALFQGTWPGW